MNNLDNLEFQNINRARYEIFESLPIRGTVKFGNSINNYSKAKKLAIQRKKLHLDNNIYLRDTIAKHFYEILKGKRKDFIINRIY